MGTHCPHDVGLVLGRCPWSMGMGVTGSPKAVPAGERLSAGEEDNSQSQRNGREIGVRDTEKPRGMGVGGW